MRAAPSSDFDAVDREFRDHAGRHGLFTGDLRLEGTRLTRNFYPVYVAGATKASAVATQRLRDLGILSFGKQGGFDYQPTAWVSAEVAEKELGARAA